MEMSDIGLGTSNIASLGRAISPEMFSRMLQVAREKKTNVIDTADTYGSGDSERLISKCLKNKRSSFFIVTKAGLPYVNTPSFLSPLNQIGKKVKQKLGYQKKFNSEYVIKSVAKSNQRLNTEAVDAFLLHEPSFKEIDGVDCWTGLEKIKKSGLARFTGVSSNDYAVVKQGIETGQVDLVETSFTWTKSYRNSIVELCNQYNIPVMVNQVLKPYRSLQQLFNKNKDTIHQLEGLQGISLVQLLIAAIVAENKVKTVLVGTSDLNHLSANIDSLKYSKAISENINTIKNLLQ